MFLTFNDRRCGLAPSRAAVHPAPLLASLSHSSPRCISLPLVPSPLSGSGPAILFFFSPRLPAKIVPASPSFFTGCASFYFSFFISFSLIFPTSARPLLGFRPLLPVSVSHSSIGPWPLYEIIATTISSESVTPLFASTSMRPQPPPGLAIRTVSDRMKRLSSILHYTVKNGQPLIWSYTWCSWLTDIVAARPLFFEIIAATISMELSLLSAPDAPPSPTGVYAWVHPSFGPSAFYHALLPSFVPTSAFRPCMVFGEFSSSV
jgi:hypothetical protein